MAILVALVYVPFIQPLFETASLSLTDWLYLYSMAPLILLVEEFRKAVTRRLGKNTSGLVDKRSQL